MTDSPLTRALREQMPEMLPKLRRVVEDAEAAGEGDWQEVGSLRARMEDVERKHGVDPLAVREERALANLREGALQIGAAYERVVSPPGKDGQTFKLWVTDGERSGPVFVSVAAGRTRQAAGSARRHLEMRVEHLSNSRSIEDLLASSQEAPIPLPPEGG